MREKGPKSYFKVRSPSKLNTFDFYGIKMTVITKSAKTHSAAKKCCGWEEPVIYVGGGGGRHKEGLKNAHYRHLKDGTYFMGTQKFV